MWTGAGKAARLRARFQRSACRCPSAASGKKISFSGTNIYRMKKGKIAEELGQEQASSARQQLGRAPRSNIGKCASTIRVAGWERSLSSPVCIFTAAFIPLPDHIGRRLQ
jgi:hypothetical protein